MHIISRKRLNDFAEQYPETKNALAHWYKTMKTRNFDSFAALKSVYNSVDKVGQLSVFNIGGNKVRLIAAIHYNTHRVYIRAILTHAEYDLNKWSQST